MQARIQAEKHLSHTQMSVRVHSPLQWYLATIWDTRVALAQDTPDVYQEDYSMFYFPYCSMWLLRKQATNS